MANFAFKGGWRVVHVHNFECSSVCYASFGKRVTTLEAKRILLQEVRHPSHFLTSSVLAWSWYVFLSASAEKQF